MPSFHQEIAEIFEQELNAEQAMHFYDKAADLFQIEDLTFSADRYQRAIKIYEDIAWKSINGYMTKFGGVVAITNALERYQELDSTFSGTREYKLLADLAVATDEKDVTKYADAVKKFEMPSTDELDTWKTALLSRVKESLKAKELEEADLT
ncbi:hypothetical protein AgCh_035604 [Apium graveolens]